MKTNTFWVATLLFVSVFGVAKADNFAGSNANSGSFSNSSAIGAYGGDPSAGAFASGGDPTAQSQLNYSNVTNVVPGKYRTQYMPQFAQVLPSNANKFFSAGKGPAQMAQPVAGTLTRSCNKYLAGEVDTSYNPSHSAKNAEAKFSPYYDYSNNWIKQRGGRQQIHAVSRFFEYMRSLPVGIKHQCVGVITVDSTVGVSVPVNDLNNAASALVQKEFGDIGDVLLVAEETGLTELEGVNNDGLSIGGSLGSSGNTGSPLAAASVSAAINDTDVMPRYLISQTFYLMREVIGDEPGHDIAADVRENDQRQALQLAQNAQADKAARLERAVEEEVIKLQATEIAKQQFGAR